MTVTTLLAAETALGLLFDPRWRDFPFASLTMAAVPFFTLALLNRPISGRRPIAETVFAALFVAIGLYATFNEGFDNWQAGTTITTPEFVALCDCSASTFPSFLTAGDVNADGYLDFTLFGTDGNNNDQLETVDWSNSADRKSVV